MVQLRATIPSTRCGPACKPGPVHVPCGTATAIYLAGRLPGRSSGLPEGRGGPDQPCPLIWPCSRWGLPSQPVARLLVGSYIKGPDGPPTFSPLPGVAAGRYAFCCTFPVLRPPLPRMGEPAGSDGGRYPPPRPVEPGLSSPRSAAVGAEAPRRPSGQRPSGRPAKRCTWIIRLPGRSIHHATRPAEQESWETNSQPSWPM